MKTLPALVIALSLAASASAQTSLDKKPRSAKPLASEAVKFKPTAAQIAEDKRHHAEIEAAAEARAQKAAAKDAGEIQSSGRVIQVTKDGLLVSQGSKTILLRDHPSAGAVADGELVTFRGVPDGVFRYTTALQTEATVRVYRVTSLK